jgi:hypothetical protein
MNHLDMWDVCLFGGIALAGCGFFMLAPSLGLIAVGSCLALLSWYVQKQ